MTKRQTNLTDEKGKKVRSAEQLIDEAVEKAGGMDELVDVIAREERTLRRIRTGTIPLSDKLRKRLETFIDNSGDHAAKFGVLKEEPAKYIANGERTNLSPVPFKKSRKIRVYSMIQAGLATIYESVPESWEDVVDYDGTDTGAFALRVTGDSMLPRFPSGTVIIVSPQYPPRYGDFVAAYIKDEGALFKKFVHTGDAKSVTLVSLNEDFPPVERPREDFDWIYRVVEAREINL